MACGNPPEPGRATPPSNGANFAAAQTHDLLRNVELTIGRVGPGEVLDRAMEKAINAIDRLKASGASADQIKHFEGKLEALKGFAQGRMRDGAVASRSRGKLGEKAASGRTVLNRFSEVSAEKNAPTVARALANKNHWRHDEYKQVLYKTIEGSRKIPDAYKGQILRDTEKLLRVCPSAGGLVKAMTLRGQAEGKALVNRLGSRGNDAIGAAYEIMGTAALSERSSHASNTKHSAPSLHIDPAKDKLVFGPKSHLNHKYNETGKIGDRTRRTIEGDAQFFRNGREIAIDFKHVKEAGTKGSSADHRNQVENVTRAIQHGMVNEYHFVTNGTFSKPFKEAIDQANDVLVASGDTPIAYHEHVSSIASDPHADGTA